MTDRKAQLASNLAKVEDRIAAACVAAGRKRDEVTLIVVTKTYPASDVRILSELGVRHVAENKDQDAAPKAAECSDLSLVWHFVGQLQTNKVRSVVRYADLVQSVDRSRLVTTLSKEAVRAGREVGCLIQVALDADDSGRGERGGVGPGGIEELADLLAESPGVRVDGLMTVAPLTGEYAGRQRAAFERLMVLSTDLRRAHPAANMVSAGMSADLEDAVAAGATHVRVGTAVLGVRPGLG
ncbi:MULTISPECIES: YggS family pyridoxal phosphate-dependent enzyme [Streptomyces]|uniref:Pyridoxal phosphate homeostasis protein n=1 Tax=Streptomyces caniscabiei TaxID=2746961 RepID=A0ABU4MI87_9ACTN|nr:MULTISPECIES: YggS family pyridoxal phosphate-dependent enzyme [Streptomyces]MBE4735967.1 YggS family pyridoxal phosphate-dependent enzyme [Streptomyces caniscabiei]MBE4755905.1 YggS family pyridoxal phosphate-dependent enzyme [Streptomyces caniscabiei]MBE4771507.1 YggS family pyridoxal phosphate-dependent enzyme [Streptomyces caniscabiei]MBE4786066.1 YggS family pyridoxal phosphate-dependent enzyme [Streptomyces caniscabiei]MBE4794087.1 YggS family pyridoxal phosphate-dependent enzyme [Str